MKRLMVRTGFVLLLLSTKSQAQSQPVIPQVNVGQGAQASCVILERMGRIDRSKSRLYSFGISGKRFRYVEGKLPEGFSLHHKMTDHDVRDLQARGAQVLFLDSHYTSENLQEARANCQRETDKTPNQVEAKASPAAAPAPISNTPPTAPKPLIGKATTPKADDSASFARPIEPAAGTPAPATNPPTATPSTAKARAPKTNDTAPSPGTTEAALVDVSSSPTEAEVYIDERFFGRTPATTIVLMPGDHKIVIKKSGFVVWKKKFKLPSGRTNVDAALLPKAK